MKKIIFIILFIFLGCLIVDTTKQKRSCDFIMDMMELSYLHAVKNNNIKINEKELDKQIYNIKSSYKELVCGKDKK